MKGASNSTTMLTLIVHFCPLCGCKLFTETKEDYDSSRGGCTLSCKYCELVFVALPSPLRCLGCVKVIDCCLGQRLTTVRAITWFPGMKFY